MKITINIESHDVLREDNIFIPTVLRIFSHFLYPEYSGFEESQWTTHSVIVRRNPRLYLRSLSTSLSPLREWRPFRCLILIGIISVCPVRKLLRFLFYQKVICVDRRQYKGRETSKTIFKGWVYMVSSHPTLKL